MSSQSRSPHPLTPPCRDRATGTRSKLEKAIQHACKRIRRNFSTEDDDDDIKQNLDIAWAVVGSAIQLAGDSNLKKRVKNQFEFYSYVAPGSNEERELTNLLKSMAKEEVPWEDLFNNGTLLSSLDAKRTDHHIISLEAFVKPELENQTNRERDLGAQ
jgi:hypothetical protein